MDYTTDFSDQYVPTSAGKLHCMRHAAHGKRLVFLHGIGGTTRVWRRLLEYIPDSFDVTLVDMLGHGLSDAPEVEYSVDLQASAVAELLSKLDMHQSYLIGHSYGAWVAALLGETTDYAVGIVLEDPAGLRDYFNDMESTGTIEERRAMMLKSLRMLGNKDYVMNSMLQNGGTADGMLTSENLNRIRVPALIIWGTEDQTVPIKYLDAFASGIRNSSIARISGAMHDPHYSNPKEVADAILRFTGRP